MRLRFTKTALQQIDKALAYIETHSPKGAVGLRKRIESATDLVRNHPHAAQATSRSNTRRVVLTPYPYVLFYRIATDEVVVARLRHAARRPSRRRSDPDNRGA